MGKESVRASEFIHENIHKDVAIDDPNDPELTPLYYHTLGSRTVNNILHQHYRGETEIDPKSPSAKHIKKMDKVLKRFILSKPAKVYTGIPISVEHAYEKYKADRSKPIKLHLPAYTSATTKFLQAISFSVGRGNNILMIELPIGTPAVSLKKISSHEYEKEVLLPRNTSLKFIGYDSVTIGDRNPMKIGIFQRMDK